MKTRLQQIYNFSPFTVFSLFIAPPSISIAPLSFFSAQNRVWKKIMEVDLLSDMNFGIILW